MGKFWKASVEENVFKNPHSKYSTANYAMYTTEVCDYMNLHI